MSILAALGRRLWGARSIEDPSRPLEDPDWTIGTAASDAGIAITPRRALGYAAVWRAVNLLARDVGKLPLWVFRRDGAGKVRDWSHPAAALLRRSPNPQMGAKTFRETLMAHVLLRGNGYAFIERDGAGRPLALWPLAPDRTTPVRVNGALMYVTTVVSNSREEKHRIAAADMLHIRGLGYDGLEGYDVLTYAADTLGLGIAARKLGAHWFRNGAEPSVIIQHPQRLSPEARANLRDEWNRMHQGIEHAHRVAILQEGMQVSPFSLSARQAQLLETREFELKEIASWFGVPVHKVGGEGRTAFASLEQENLSYLTESLDPWLVTWEEECSRKLLTDEERGSDSHAVEFVREALARADIAARSAYYQTAILTGWMSRDEVRARENLNPIPDGAGEGFLVPMNHAPPPTSDPVTDPVGDPVSDPAPAASVEDARTDSAGSIRAAAGVVLVDAVRRMTTRVCRNAVRAARSPAALEGWLSTGGIEREHGATIRAALVPAVAALGAAGVAATADAIASHLVAALGERIASMSAATASAEADQIERELPEQMAAAIMGRHIGAS